MCASKRYTARSPCDGSGVYRHCVISVPAGTVNGPVDNFTVWSCIVGVMSAGAPHPHNQASASHRIPELSRFAGVKSTEQRVDGGGGFGDAVARRRRRGGAGGERAIDGV